MPLSFKELITLLPLLVPAAGAVLCLLAAAFTAGRRAVPVLTVATLLCSLASLPVVAPMLPAKATGLLVMDGVAFLAAAVILTASLAIALIGRSYLGMLGASPAEFDVLLLLAALGGLVVATSSHFASLVLGVELLGIPLVAMAAYRSGDAPGLEAGFKYLVLAGLSSAMLLFGMALLYAASGSLRLEAVAGALRGMSSGSVLAPLGALMLAAGLAFKLALVPFHAWAPDVYEGAPAPVTMFAATVSKTAVFVALLRVFPPLVLGEDRFLFAVFGVLSVASMVAGNLLALTQKNVKRMLAYSSIAHSGYILVAFLAGGSLAAPAVLFYLVAYVATNLVAFGVVALLSGPDADAGDLDGYAGLAWRSPWTGVVFTLALASLLGIPVTAGFIAKYSVAAAGVTMGQLALVIILVLNTAVSAAYYIRVIMTLYLRHDEPREAAGLLGITRPPALGSVIVTVLAALVVLFGVLPQYLVDHIQRLIRL